MPLHSSPHSVAFICISRSTFLPSGGPPSRESAGGGSAVETAQNTTLHQGPKRAGFGIPQVDFPFFSQRQVRVEEIGVWVYCFGAHYLCADCFSSCSVQCHLPPDVLPHVLQGFVPDPNTGYYVNAESGYYYDAGTKLYYHPTTLLWCVPDPH